jgi:hypothetical protein
MNFAAVPRDGFERRSRRAGRRGPQRALFGAVGPQTSPVAPRAGEQGIMLLECLIYLAIWVVVVGLAFASFYRYLDYSKRLNRTADDIVRTLRAGETWREDVRRATGPPRLVAAGGAEQALHIPHPTGEVVYVFIDGAVSRRTAPDAPWTEVLGGVESSAMQSDQRKHVQAWRWEVELKPRQKDPRVKPLFSFEAVPASRS